jgi:hypothetical protein
METTYQTLLEQIADVEERLQNPTLSPSDRLLLTLAWNQIASQLDEMETIDDNEPLPNRFVPLEEWHDASAALEEPDDAPPTPPPTSPIRLAPSPPPIVFAPGDHVPPPPVTRSVSFHGIPPLSATRQSVPIPADWRPMEAPPPPGWDSDEEEEIERMNNAVDDRGCENCSGCPYCSADGYDGADEI